MYMPAQDLTIAESNRSSSQFDEYIITFNDVAVSKIDKR